jgi:hypothetical protein
MSKPKRRSWLGRIFSVLISTFISLLVLELILRTFLPAYQTSIPEAYQYDSELGFRLRPGIHLFKTADFQQEVQVNNLGTVNFQENFDGYETIVFAVGDSFTQGTGLPADMSYPAQLDLMLNKDAQGFYTKKYGVVNLGLAAFGGEQSVLTVRRWATVVRQPKYILYLGCVNDYEDDVLFKSGYSNRHLVEGNPAWGSMVRPMQWLTNDLQIGIRAKLLLAEARRSQLGAADGKKYGVPENPPSTAELEQAALEKLAAYAKENNATLIVGWSEEGLSYDWLKVWAANNSIRFADWGPKVNSVLASIPSLPTENQHSAAHHRGWVNHLIAEEYARQIND